MAQQISKHLHTYATTNINSESHSLVLRAPAPHANPTTLFLATTSSPGTTTLKIRFPGTRTPFLPGPAAARQRQQVDEMGSRIHPSNAGRGGGRRAKAAAPVAANLPPAVFTVWKRSSMGFQGTDGFCVYDAAGGLAFRVDNYSRKRKLCAGEVLLMDGRGAPLLSIRPQLLSLHDRWNCYTATDESPCADGKKQQASTSQQQLVFTMHRSSALQSSDQAEVHMAATAGAAPSSSGLSCKHHGAVALAPSPPSFQIEGSFSRRNCKIRGSDGRDVARISRKSAGVASRPVATLGDDVFSLVVRPGVDAATVMAMVVVMDRICRRPYTPMVCSSDQ